MLPIQSQTNKAMVYTNFKVNLKQAYFYSHYEKKINNETLLEDETELLSLYFFLLKLEKNENNHIYFIKTMCKRNENVHYSFFDIYCLINILTIN